MEIIGRCDICNVDIPKASSAKHLRSNKYSQNAKQNVLNIPEGLFQEHADSQIKNYILLDH